MAEEVNKRWQCPKCGQWWPAYTNSEAFRKRAKAAEKHPGEWCQQPVSLDTPPPEP